MMAAEARRQGARIRTMMLALAGLAWMAGLAVPTPAAAQPPGAGDSAEADTVASPDSPLYAPKEQGLIGERPDGLLGYVADEVPPDVVALVEKTNAERLARYRQLAEENGLSLGQVKAVVGQKLLARAPRGFYVMSPAGRWHEKQSPAGTPPGG